MSLVGVAYRSIGNLLTATLLKKSLFHSKQLFLLLHPWEGVGIPSLPWKTLAAPCGLPSISQEPSLNYLREF